MSTALACEMVESGWAACRDYLQTRLLWKSHKLMHHTEQFAGHLVGHCSDKPAWQ